MFIVYCLSSKYSGLQFYFREFSMEEVKKKKKMSKCICLVCDSEFVLSDNNYNVNSEKETSSVNRHLKWTVFCQYFNLDLEKGSEIMNMENLPFCKKCSPFLDQLSIWDKRLESILQNMEKILANLSKVLISSAKNSMSKQNSCDMTKNKTQDDEDEEEMKRHIRICRRAIAQNYDPKIPLSRYNFKSKAKQAAFSNKNTKNVNSSATISHSTPDLESSESKVFIYDKIWKFIQIETEFKCSTCHVVKPTILSMKRHIRNFHSAFSTNNHPLTIFSNTEIQENSSSSPSSTQHILEPRISQLSNSDSFLGCLNNNDDDNDPLLIPSDNIKTEINDENDYSKSTPTFHISIPLTINNNNNESFYDESNDVGSESEMDEYQEEEEEDVEEQEKKFSPSKRKPFKCDVPNCNKAYQQRYNLTVHKKWHMTGHVRKFTCKICNSQYTRNSKLKEHEWKKHQLKTPKESTARNKTCPVCNITFRRPGLLEKHVRGHKRDSVPNKTN